MDDLSEPTQRVIRAAQMWLDYYGESMHPLQIRKLAHGTPGASYAALIVALGCGLDRNGERVWLGSHTGSARAGVYVGDRDTRAALVKHGLDRVRARMVGPHAPR